jgi:hypothetical protein
MSIISDDLEVDLPCECGKKNIKTVGWIKANEQLVCESCGRVTLLDPDKSLQSITNVEIEGAEMLDDLERSLDEE